MLKAKDALKKSQKAKANIDCEKTRIVDFLAKKAFTLGQTEVLALIESDIHKAIGQGKELIQKYDRENNSYFKFLHQAKQSSDLIEHFGADIAERYSQYITDLKFSITLPKLNKALEDHFSELGYFLEMGLEQVPDSNAVSYIYMISWDDKAKDKIKRRKVDAVTDRVLGDK